VSPFAGAEAFAMLCARGYRPVELSNVVFQQVTEPAAVDCSNITVRVAGLNEARLWSEISARGWSHDHPEFAGMMLGLGEVTAAREHTICFIAEFDGIAGAAGALCLHDSVALFGGSATVPELRRRGLQSALLRARMQFAFEQGCDLAMMAAMPGSDSQRNAERAGFRIAYTRTKWQLMAK
jgi:GNAT superfamily N-acetyltransferase